MADMIRPAPMPRSFMTDAPTTAMNAGLTLLSRRSTALAEFWRSCAEVREPTDFMALQLNYWTQLVDDYQEVLAQSMSSLGAAAEAAAPQTPRAAAQGQSRPAS